MTTIATTASRTRRRMTTGAALLVLALVSSGCSYGTWGIRASYRQYVTAAFSGGHIEVSQGVTWISGEGTGQGPFKWPVDFAEFDASTETGVIQFRGGVSTAAHPAEGGYVLETSYWSPRLEIEGDTGTLYVDLNYRPYGGTNPETLPPLVAETDVAFAEVDLSGVDWTPDAEGDIHVVDAPMVGITDAMVLIGWDQFYGDPVTLDPLSVSFAPGAAALTGDPRIVVSATEDLAPGDEIIVWGWGFDPAANLGTRPPLAGQPAGAYTVFGRFADGWQPSTGAPSSARTVIQQRWALPQSSIDAMGGPNPAFARIDESGRFETTLVVGEGGTTGNYGVYTYPGSGAVNADYELSVPIDLVPAAS